MATQTLEVIFQNGAFRPVGEIAVPISEGQHARVVVEVEESKSEAQAKPRVAGLHKGLIGWDPSFNDELPDSFWLGEE